MGIHINMENLYRAFVILVQGMAGIFVTILVIMAVVCVLTKMMANQEAGENKED